jgi:hypothetical protein
MSNKKQLVFKARNQLRKGSFKKSAVQSLNKRKSGYSTAKTHLITAMAINKKKKNMLKNQELNKNQNQN